MTRHFWKRLIAFSIVMAAAASALLADVNSLPVKVVNGKSYHYYEVQPKETIFSLERKLGISRDVIYANNPSTRDGLKAFSTLLFPVADNSQNSSSSASLSSNVPTHKVAKSETIYGISKKYGVTTEQLFTWNPETRNGLKAGQTIYVADPSQVKAKKSEKTATENLKPSNEPVKTAKPTTRDYLVKKNETFYSIARSHDMTLEQFEELNPGIGLLHEGDIVKIPADAPQPEQLAETIILETSQEDAPTTTSTPMPSAISQAAPEIASIETVVVEPASKEINIALVLPLMLNQKPQSKQAQLFTEYVKGFLIGVDSLRHEGTPIKVSVYDTCSSLDTLTSILEKDTFKEARVVVAPDNESHLMKLAAYGRSNNVYVFNPFVVKDDSYTTNPYVLQANIPQQQMYEKAIDGVITRYADCLPVFVSREDGANEKEAFVKEMKQRFDQADIKYVDLTFNNRLNKSKLNELPSGRTYLFIPTSGRQAEANKIFPGLIDFKDAGNQIVVFGYPEWTTFRGETLANMHSLNAIVYSRFFTASDDQSGREIDSKFIYWYGTPMNNVLPRQGLLGFDSAMYLIKAMEENGGDFTLPVNVPDGIQNGFHFVTPVGSRGMINDVLYFINFGENETVQRTRL